MALFWFKICFSRATAREDFHPRWRGLLRLSAFLQSARRVRCESSFPFAETSSCAFPVFEIRLRYVGWRFFWWEYLGVLWKRDLGRSVAHSHVDRARALHGTEPVFGSTEMWLLHRWSVRYLSGSLKSSCFRLFSFFSLSPNALRSILDLFYA